MTADKTLTFSDGRVATIRPAFGEHLEKGAAIVGKNASNAMSLMMGVAGQVTTVDGKPLLYEDIKLLPLGDVFALIGEVAGNAVVPSQLSAINS